MAFTYKIDPALGLVFFVGLDTTGAEILQAEKVVSHNPLRLPSMKIIIDTTQGGVDISLNDIKEVIKMNRKRMGNGDELEATAFITNNQFANLLGDAFRLLSEGIPLNFGIFSTLPDAIKWLGLATREEEILEIQAELRRTLKD